MVSRLQKYHFFFVLQILEGPLGWLCLFIYKICSIPSILAPGFVWFLDYH